MSDAAGAPRPVVEPPAETTMALASLLRPSTDLASYVTRVLAEQQRLLAQVDFLNAKLEASASQSPIDGELLRKVDEHVNKLRAARRRVGTLTSSLEASKARLARVHAHLKAGAAVAERENAASEAALDCEVPL